MEAASRIETDDYIRCFAPVWTDITGQLRRDHPAPFPIEIPRRLIRMFSFAGDTVVDPFAGTGTTALAAMETERHSVSVEVDLGYISSIETRLTTSDHPGQVEVVPSDPKPEGLAAPIECAADVAA
jgi:DNA modification methylase